MTGAALGGHVAHVVVFGVPVLLLGAMIGWQELRARTGESAGRADWHSDGAYQPEHPPVALWVAAVGLVVAALVHVIVIPEHFREYVPYGVFFAGLTAVQVLVAVVLVRRRPDLRTTRYVALASLCVVALWLVSRTTGLPIGPEPWEREAYGVPDIVASCAELVTALGCLVHLSTTPTRRRPLPEPAEVLS